MFVLFARAPEALDLRYDGVKRQVPPAAGSISLVPAGSPIRVRSSGCTDQLHILLEAGLVARVAAEAFELDPARASVEPIDGESLPQLRAMMLAVNDELTSAAAAGGELLAESLANVLAVQLIRRTLAPRRPERARDGALPRDTLSTVIDYIEEHLDANLTLESQSDEMLTTLAKDTK